MGLHGYDHDRLDNNRNDLVMPGCFGDHDNMHKELAEGTLKIEDLKACIARLVSVIWKSNQYLQ